MARPNYPFTPLPLDETIEDFEATVDALETNGSFADWQIEQGDLDGAEETLQWIEKVLIPMRDAALAIHPEWAEEVTV